jgi:gluconokinase
VSGDRARVIVVMGVAGAGKTTVGAALAAALGVPFYDADDFHEPAAIARMRQAQALTDEDRAPWLARLGALIARLDRENTGGVLACSALKARYRDVLTSGVAAGRVIFVHLDVPREIATARLVGRPEHYMPASLVDSQFSGLEPPAEAITLDGTAPVEENVAAVVAALRR